MATAAITVKPRGLALILAWRRVRFTLIVAGALGLLLSLGNETATYIVVARAMLVGLASMLAFGVFEQWPRNLPRWLPPRSALQLIGVAAVVPFAAALAYLITTGWHPDFAHDPKRVTGYAMLTFTGVLFAPWISVAVMLRQRDAFARDQALAFQLERSEFERKGLDTRLRLLQAQVEPHFLFNTLASVRSLVTSDPQRASQTIDALAQHLRATLPKMRADTGVAQSTLGEQFAICESYLELMKVRLGDRLRVEIQLPPQLHDIPFPPLLLISLVENAIKHGVEPKPGLAHVILAARIVEEGGRKRLEVQVEDDGAGLKLGMGEGTGLANIRTQLLTRFASTASLQLSERNAGGVLARLVLPLEPAAA